MRSKLAELVQSVIPWCILMLGAVIVGVSYPALPPVVPLFRTPLGEPLLSAAKEPWVAGRLVAMGLGQLAVASMMVWHCGMPQYRGWRAFWRGAMIVAALKTLIECIGFAALRWEEDVVLTAMLALAPLVPVVAFLVWAAAAWYRGRLGAHPRLSIVATLLVASALGLWLGAATLHLWISS